MTLFELCTTAALSALVLLKFIEYRDDAPSDDVIPMLLQLFWAVPAHVLPLIIIARLLYDLGAFLGLHP